MFKDIEQVLFYKNKKGEIASCILYSDGTTKNVSRHKGEKALFKVACKQGYSDINDLNRYIHYFFDEDSFKYHVKYFINTKEKMKNNIHSMIGGAFPDNNGKKKKKKFKFNNFRKNHPKIAKLIKPAIIIVSGIFIWIGAKAGLKTVKNYFSSDKKIENNVDDKNNTKSKHKESIGDYKNLNSAIEHSNINPAKKSAVKSTWKFLKNYNKDVAKQYSDKKSDKKLAHTWNESMAYYLAYNDIKQSDINKIFGKYKFNALKMKNAYKDAIEQDIQAYSVLSSSLGKEELIVSSEGKNFYIDYEKMMIKFNSIDDSEYITRESVANEFYKKVKKDLLSNKNIKSYKLSVIPIVKTFNKLTRNMHFSEKLTNDEIREINDLSSSVYSKFKKYERNLETNRMTDKALDNQDNEISYSSLKNLGIRQLRVNDYYNIKDSKRDITNSTIYTESIEKAKPTTIPHSNNNNNNISSNNTVTNNKEKNVNQNSKEKEQKIKNKNNKKKKVNSNDFIPVNYNWIPVDNGVDDFYTDEEANTTIPDYNDISNVQISNDYMDNAGSIDSSVKDITTDATGAVSQDTELPNPNSEQSSINTEKDYSPEVVADMFVNSMANDNIVTPTNNTYKKI